MSDHYVHIEISVVGPGHAKIGETVIMQLHGHTTEEQAERFAGYILIHLRQIGYEPPPEHACDPASDTSEEA